MVGMGVRNSAVKSTVSSHAQEASGMEPTGVWVGASGLASSSESGTGTLGAAGALKGSDGALRRRGRRCAGGAASARSGTAEARKLSEAAFKRVASASPP